MTVGPLVGGLVDATGNAYYHTFTAGCVMAVIALLAAIGVYLRFLSLGGPRDYVAPE